ncbi:MAG: hypothetical protein OXF27_05070 [Acidobacteria bacterium]|nr:hypothetical protein [Acidobacteriota bacterium]
MNSTTNGYELLLRRPAPPPEIVPILKRAWDAYRTEDWLLNQAWPEGCSAPGKHLTAAGTDDAGRWAVHDGQRLRATDCEWLRHITEVRTIRRTWWRTRWQSWPPRAGQTRQPGELRIALDCDLESPAETFQLYAALGDDLKPIGAPELRTFDPDADTGMPTEAAVFIETNPAASDLLEWLAWLLFDGRRSALR